MTMAAFTFLCDQSTERECLERLLFGTNRCLKPLSRIQVGDYLFLWNYETGILRGPFLALTKFLKNIASNVWPPRRFPFQVRVDARLAYQQPLTADDLGRAGLLHDTKLGLMPDVELLPEHLKHILEMFRRRNGETGPLIVVDDLPIVPGTEDMVGTAFIFKCDAVTGGRCFSENIMGAPMPVFRDVVSTVQPGARIFLWHINERRLYGIWRAASRGQYDPTAFPEAPGRGFHGVVHCTREHNLAKGIDEATVRAAFAFDGAIPPYKISPSDAERLTEALFAANGAVEPVPPERRAEPKYLAEDGHRVRSQGELIIDNMLFAGRHVHAYERRVQVGNDYLRCDFFLPHDEKHRDVYVEYWGLLSEPRYADRRQQKLAIYRQAGIEPLELFPKDLQVLAEVWPAKLSRYEIRRG